MRAYEFLTEMIWDDRFEAAKQARKYPGAWIHFSQITKLGVNPSKGHKDPPGIYFYPIRYLFDENTSPSQYATEYKYFYIARFKKSAKIINLGRMKMDTVTRIATNNGWIDDLKRVMTDPTLLKNQPTNHKLLKKPGAIFYATMDYLVNVEGKSWMSLLKGVDGLYDPSYGIISGGELAQAVIFGRQHLDILKFGENKDWHDQEYAGILKQIADELNGKFYYKHKKPVADFAIDGKPFRIELDIGNYIINRSYFHEGFWLTEQIHFTTYNAGGRDNAYRSIKYYVVSTAEKADTGGNGFFWNGDTVGRLVRLIRPVRRLYQRVENDELHVSQNIDSVAGFYSWLNAVVDKDDRVTVTIRMEHDKLDIKILVENKFPPNTPLQEAADKMLEDFAKAQIEKMTHKDPEVVMKFMKYFGYSPRLSDFIVANLKS